jgi:23S rRNA (uracil1939-C5)-methyltransferase
MRRKKEAVIIEKLEIIDIAAEGKALGKHKDKVIFVDHVAPGDIVDIIITKDKKSYANAVPTFFHKYSNERQTAFCQHFGVCGGCKLQHINYETQLFYKRKQVKDNFERIGKLNFTEILPILPSTRTTYYRNKLEYTFSNRKWLTDAQMKAGVRGGDALGFHIPGRFDKIINIEHCYLQADPSNQIRLEVADYARKNGWTFFDMMRKEGFLRNLIIRTSSIGEIMVIVQVFEDKKEAILNLLSHLKNKFPDITSLYYVINQKGNETFHDLELQLFHGKPYITEKMEELEFRVGPKSFYQTNSEQAYTLYKVTRDFASLTGNEVVYDLYTGTGTIANFVASKAKKVIGIEYVTMAIEDAKINSDINSIQNTKFYAGDMKDVLSNEFVSDHGKPDVIITDPPRAGMHEDVIEMLRRIAAKRIVYVSCNPATQARDLSLLSDLYDIKKVQPVDMFPHTHHVENVVLLEKR